MHNGEENRCSRSVFSSVLLLFHILVFGTGSFFCLLLFPKNLWVGHGPGIVEFGHGPWPPAHHPYSAVCLYSYAYIPCNWFTNLHCTVLDPFGTCAVMLFEEFVPSKAKLAHTNHWTIAHKFSCEQMPMKYNHVLNNSIYPPSIPNRSTMSFRYSVLEVSKKWRSPSSLYSC